MSAVSSITRRAFLGGGVAAAAAGISGCATNPVSGRRQLMLLSKADEIRIDQANAPHQLSFDYGAMQDAGLNAYIASVGDRLTPLTHRPDMPYSFRGVNAVHVNAYAFPGGTIAVTRGVLLAMRSETQLAALLGHEIAHVTARHSAAAMSTATMTQLGLLLAGAAVAMYDEDYTDLAVGLGGFGAFLYLAKYSRDNEREADKLALKYMTAANYHPRGLVDLMDVLRNLNQRQPNLIDVMFSTHPMSDERYQDARRRAQRLESAADSMEIAGQRYMDYTAPVRAIEPAVRAMQQGERAMVNDRPEDADDFFRTALATVPDDYTALLLMAKSRLARERFSDARDYATAAQQAYPGEAQAWHVGGMANLRDKRFDAALAHFQRYEKLLPGNPNTVFFTGYTHEQMQQRDRAADAYRQYLRMAPNGDHAGYVRERLTEWTEHV